MDTISIELTKNGRTAYITMHYDQHLASLTRADMATVMIGEGDKAHAISLPFSELRMMLDAIEAKFEEAPAE